MTNQEALDAWATATEARIEAAKIAERLEERAKGAILLAREARKEADHLQRKEWTAAARVMV